MLVTCIAGSLSRIGDAAMTRRKVAFNQQINAIAPTNTELSPFLYVQTLLMKPVLQSASTGGMKGMLSKSRLSAIEYVVPPAENIRAFGELFNQYEKVHKDFVTASIDSTALFNALTHQAFTGQL